MTVPSTQTPWSSTARPTIPVCLQPSATTAESVFGASASKVETSLPPASTVASVPTITISVSTAAPSPPMAVTTASTLVRPSLSMVALSAFPGASAPTTFSFVGQTSPITLPSTATSTANFSSIRACTSPTAIMSILTILIPHRSPPSLARHCVRISPPRRSRRIWTTRTTR